MSVVYSTTAMEMLCFSQRLQLSSRIKGNIAWELQCVHRRSPKVWSRYYNEKAIIHLKSQTSPTYKQLCLTSFFPEIQKSRYSQRFQYHSIRSQQGTDTNVILKTVSRTAEVSVLSISATEAVQEACFRHKAAPTAAAALGRALIGTLLLGAVKDDAETVQVQFAGNGPLGQITTVASGGGLVKGFVGNPLCDLPLSANQKINVGTAVGSGVMNVVYSQSKWTQPYTGSIPIYSGEIAEDFTHYLAESEQINTAIGIGVTFTREATVQSANGFLVQVLPFCSEETILKLEENIQKMGSLSDTCVDRSAYSIIEDILIDIGIGDTYKLGFPKYGPCDSKDLKHRMLRAIASLGPEDIKRLLQEQGHIEVKCEFCAEVFHFHEADIQDILGS